MFAARQQQRIDQPLARDQHALDALELGAQEAVIEAGIVDHQRRVADKAEEIIDDLDEALVALQEFGRQPMNGEGLRRHVALRIEVGVERRPGRNPVEQLDAADLDQAVALARVKAGGFGVEDDFAHVLQLAPAGERITAAVLAL